MLLFLLFDDDDDVHDQRAIYPRRIFKPRINFNLPSTSFREAFRVDKQVVSRIENAIGFELHRNTIRSQALSPREQILITLHFLGNGAQYHVNGHMHGFHKGTICRSVHRVCYLITNRLMPSFIRWPTNSREIDRLFERKAGFPNVMGSIDGKLIHIDAPSHDEPAYVSRDNKHAINVTVVCGPKLEFYFVSAKCPGSFHDSRCLQVSNLWNNWENLGWRPNDDHRSIILGDSAYPLRPWLMTPIIHNFNDLPHLQRAKRLYLQRHRRTRFVVECAIGVWKEQFPCLNQFRIRAPHRIANAIYTAATLHNMQKKNRHGSYDYDANLNSIVQRDYNIDDEIEVEEEDEDENGRRFIDMAAAERQLEYLEYFARI